jgi:hypothetical protein
MKVNLSTAKYAIAIMTILAIAGLLYSSNLLHVATAQNKSNSNNTGTQKKDIGSQQQLKSLTKGNQELLANQSKVSNSSIAGISKESSMGKPNMTKESGEYQKQSTPSKSGQK